MTIEKVVAIVNTNPQYTDMMVGFGYRAICINSIDEAILCKDVSLVLFTGGADVNPEIYGHTLHPTTGVSRAADNLFMAAFKVAQMNGIPCVGICRGSQFLCAMAGGTLIQDCHGHAVFAGHQAETAWGESYHVTSTHHQMQFPHGTNHTTLAWANGVGYGKEQHINGEVFNIERGVDHEVVLYHDIKALAFQPHPEFNDGDCRDLFLKCLTDFVGK